MGIRLLAICLFFATASPAMAQETAAVTVDLGTDGVQAGEQASLPLNMLAAESAKTLGGVQIDIVVPATLTFVNFSGGFTVISSKAEVKAGIVKGQDKPGESTLRIEVSASTPISEGALGTLTFQVAKDAPPDEKIPVVVRTITAKTVDGGKLSAKAGDGVVSVISNQGAVFACFFYMH